MKYCFHYNIRNRNLSKADELIFDYYEDNVNLIEKVQTISEKVRIIIDITNFGGKPNWDIIGASVQVHPNSAVLITKTQIDFVSALRMKNIKWFFADGCYTWDLLNECLNYGVTDVYIIDELGFDIINVSRVCKDKGVQVRVYPNVAQTSARLLTLGDYTSFYIRPEDVKIYEEYIDIFEFFGSSNKESVLYDIYSSEEWDGPLESLILNLYRGDMVKNSLIPNIFGFYRLECKKKCNYHACRLCKKNISSARTIKERKDEELEEG